MQKHFVEFLSPGTFCAESTVLEIESWDVEKACGMARDIVERHGSRPYGFRFLTKSRGTDDLDSKQTASSGTYYLGGKIETLDEIRARNNPDDNILIGNMVSNRWDRVIVNTNSWKWTQPLRDDDVVLDFEMAPAKSGE